MGIIIAIIIFGLIVTVHEFGHFICAKLSKVKVLEFSIGMGPKIIQKQFGETMYSLRALPVGGYCAMEGEDSENEDPRAFRNAKLWKRMVILVAGAVMNFVLGYCVLIPMVSMMNEVPTTTVSGFTGMRNDESVSAGFRLKTVAWQFGKRLSVPDLNEEISPLEVGFGGKLTDDRTIIYYASSREKLKKGYKIISINGTRVFSTLDLSFIFETATAKDGKRDVVVKRDGEKIKLNDVEFYNSIDGTEWDFGLIYNEKSPKTVIKGSSDIFMSMSHIVGLSLKQLVTGKVEKEAVSGPVGVVKEINEVATQDTENKKDTVFNLLYITALITINVGIFNLLPIPGLDGGRLLFCFIELIRRKPIKPEHEGYVHLAGMLLLFGIMIFATYNDILKLIMGG